MIGSSYFYTFQNILTHFMLLVSVYSQKQPPEVFCKKKFSYKFCKIHSKTPVP